jgi:hypothetical protein
VEYKGIVVSLSFFGNIVGMARSVLCTTEREGGSMQPPHRKDLSHMANSLLFHSVRIAVGM